MSIHVNRDILDFVGGYIMRKLGFIIMIIFCLSSCQKQPVESLVDVIDNHLILNQIVDGDYIELPSTFMGIPITWNISDESIVSNLGHVTRVYVDTLVEIEARYVFEGIEKSKTFQITIKGQPLTSDEIVDLDFSELEIPLLVSENIHLPQSGSHGSLIVWSTSASYIISRSGIYYPPIDEETVTLEAKLIFEGSEKIKTFIVTAAAMKDQDKVERDYLMLDINTQNLTSKITLPSRGYFSSQITWVSSHPEIIDAGGYYTKPIGDQLVTLTATITKGDMIMDKTFNFEIKGYDPEGFRLKLRKKLVINHGFSIIFEDLVLPSQILDIANITWESSHPELISPLGSFNSPDETTHITLTAHIISGSFEDVIDFSFKLYGKNEQNTEQNAKNIVMINYDYLNEFHLDKGENLTQGEFDHVLYLDEGLILVGGSTEGSYTSPIIHSESSVKRINLMWGSITHEKATSTLLTRYQTIEGWSEWFSHGTWGYGGPNTPPMITRNFPNNVFNIQYQILLKRERLNIPSPKLEYVSLQFVTENMPQYTIASLDKYLLYNVPQLKQADTLDASLWNNICWATSISMMLQYYNRLLHLDIPQEYYSVLIRQGTERFGTTKNDIGATQFGITLHELEFHSAEMLLHVINHYGPLIVGVSKGSSPDGKFGPLTYSSGHVVVVVGYEIHDDGKIDIIVNDPAVSWMRYPIKGSLEEFMLVWDRGGMLIQD